MCQRSPDLIEVPVHIGEVRCGSADVCLSAILGSCVGIVFIDAENRAFTLSHSLLPYSSAPEQKHCARWVDQAIEAALCLLRTPPNSYRSLRSIVAGGASMVSAPKNGQPSVGELNADAAIEMIRKKGIPIISQEVGGANGRSISIAGDSLSFQIETIPRL